MVAVRGEILQIRYTNQGSCHGAGTLFHTVSIITARARIHCSNEHEVGREREGARGARNGDDATFEGLAERFEGLGAIFRHSTLFFAK
jgi:hypothetical protein